MSLEKSWIKVTEREFVYYYLLIEFRGTVLYKMFRVLNVPGNDSLVDLNKQLKEHDVIESIRKLFGVKVSLV